MRKLPKVEKFLSKSIKYQKDFLYKNYYINKWSISKLARFLILKVGVEYEIY